MHTITRLISIADAAVARLTRLGVILALVVLFVLLMARVIARTTEIPFAAYDEIVELATVWMTLLGTVALWREGALFKVEIVTGAFPAFGRLAEIVVQALMLAFALMLVIVGGRFTLDSNELTSFMQIDMRLYYGAIPVTGVFMACYSLAGLVRAGCTLARSGTAGSAERPLTKPAVGTHL
ncbi:TRAP transporter small permease [Frigidibacter sp. MR17.24]|uniref:TRAP transporter small permease n=1 Tax=Frigidibacter sp. MR17.24 TaxID=3127345 RepID=UPI00301309EF